MSNENIWKTFSFSEKHQKSALDYLEEFKKGLLEETGGELRLDVEAVDAIIDDGTPQIVAVYKLFVVAPNLGNFRRKILTVAEYAKTGRFPVDIVNHFDDNYMLNNVPESEFNNSIARIIQNPLVKNSIENLYQQSKQNNK